MKADESGGDPNSTRYEETLFARLAAQYPGWTEQRTKDNCTSWGLTQILGVNYSGPPSELADPERNLIQALRMIAEFAERFGLDVTKDFDELFHCWNTGQPDRPTFDSNYVTNGLNRMAAYSSS